MAVLEDVPTRSPRHSSIDLQLAVLRHLPTPVIVLSQKRTAVFANRAAERVLGHTDPIQPHNDKILGQSPTDLGIKLQCNRPWGVVLDKLVLAQKLAGAEGENLAATLGNAGLVHEADVLVSNANTAHGERHFRVLFSILTADNGMHYVLSFERSTHIEKKLILENHISSPDGGPSVVQNGSTYNLVLILVARGIFCG